MLRLVLGKRGLESVGYVQVIRVFVRELLPLSGHFFAVRTRQIQIGPESTNLFGGNFRGRGIGPDGVPLGDAVA